MIAGKWTVTLIVIVTGLFYWTLDSFVDSVIFGDGTFITSLFFASAHEIYVRLTTAVVVMLAVYLGCILSGRRKIEKKLSSTAENLRALIRTAPLAIIVVDPDGKVTLWNPAAEKIFGWEEKEVLGLPNPIVPADKQAEFLMFLKRTEVGRLVTREEVSRQRKDGSLLNAILSTAPMRDSSGKFIGTMAMIADVTDRKKAEEALLESKELHRTILRTAMDGFWLVDMNGRVLEVNEAYCRMSGYSEQELLTMSIPDLECVETPSDIAARIEKILKQGEDRFEGRHRRKDGSSFPVEVSAQYKPTRGGHMFAFMRDIT
ncbi:MAG TPA: PAS domain S-box protein, partial [Thermodesulfovibrionales bacterium]|nr:PAS domain S-box protein [Thermodesulfovibrionales bacterium]